MVFFYKIVQLNISISTEPSDHNADDKPCIEYPILVGSTITVVLNTYREQFLLPCWVSENFCVDVLGLNHNSTDHRITSRLRNSQINNIKSNTSYR